VTDLDARYGRRSAGARRAIVWSVAGAIVVAAIAWFVWARPVETAPQAVWRDTGYTILDPASRISAEWELTVEPGLDARCAVYAMNQAFAIVGWRIVDVPASERRIRQLSEPILTSEAPVTGLVYRCWVA